MLRRRIRAGSWLTLAVLVLGSVACERAFGQIGGAGQAGITVDAKGVLQRQVFDDPQGEATRARVQAAEAALNANVAVKSPLRKVSLTRLEQAMEANMAQDRPPTEEMKYLAGLSRLQYVFYYPETKDIVIAGPAEGWFSDLSGRVVGLTTGRPVLELQDLAVALRAYPPGQNGAPLIGCSIDPTKEGLAAMQQFLYQIGSTATPDMTEMIVTGLRNSLGLQTVRVLGVPAATHFSLVMVEADYRMKLIGIGLERPPVKMVSYVEKADPTTVGRNALTRWYFMPDYKCVRVSQDSMAMELVGNGVKLVGADELVTRDGGRQQAGSGNRASQVFTTGFTQKYAELAAKSPVYAQLRNLIDMAVAAAYIQQQDYYSQAGWTMPILGNEEKFKVQVYQAPAMVESVVASIWKGNRLMTPIGGGVEMRAHQAIETSNLLQDEGSKVEKARQQINLKNLAAGQWWWD